MYEWNKDQKETNSWWYALWIRSWKGTTNSIHLFSNRCWENMVVKNLTLTTYTELKNEGTWLLVDEHIPEYSAYFQRSEKGQVTVYEQVQLWLTAVFAYKHVWQTPKTWWTCWSLQMNYHYCMKHCDTAQGVITLISLSQLLCTSELAKL